MRRLPTVLLRALFAAVFLLFAARGVALACVDDSDCAHLTYECDVGVCVSGECALTAAADGTPCEDGDLCTLGDACLAGVCTGSDAVDSDGDTYCDELEQGLGCDPNDGSVIPTQPAAYSGGRIFGTGGELLITFAVPDNRDVVVPLDPSCAEVGVCGPFGACTAGKIGDGCTEDADCNQPPRTCRVIMNHAVTPDLSLIKAVIRANPLVDVSDTILINPGCALKLDFSLPELVDRRRRAFVIKVLGTVDGRVRRDRDKIRFLSECPRRTRYIPLCNPEP